MIGMNPSMRIELARDYRQGQIDAAAKRRIAADARGVHARARTARRPPRHPPPPSAAAASVTRGRAPPAPRRAAPVGARPQRGSGPGATLAGHGRHRAAHSRRGPAPAHVPGRGTPAEGGAEDAAADAGRAPLLGLPAGAARAELRHRVCGLVESVAPAGAVQLLPRAGDRRQRVRGHRHRQHDPGHVQKAGQAARRERQAVDAVSDRTARAGRRRAPEAARGAGRRDQRPPHRDGDAVLGAARARVRADPPDRRDRHPRRAPHAAIGGRRRAGCVRPVAGAALRAGRNRQARLVRGRRRHRRGRGGARRGRRLPAQPAALHPPRRDGAEGRAALRPAGDGQDPARAGRRRRGGRAVLLDLGVGVHRGHRRRRREPRAGPVHTGEGGGAGDRVHRRARRDRARPRELRTPSAAVTTSASRP